MVELKGLDIKKELGIEVRENDVIIEVLIVELAVDFNGVLEVPQFFTTYKGNVKNVDILKVVLGCLIEMENELSEVRVKEMEYKVYEWK